ncbi:MAG: glycogen/starch/alpha-glucan phosphorylase [Xanthomonadales bacterium]|nr:glycogen/starch/alpha-glucan phosphorylase [Gammaproteobacteria bacterium]MBT8053989.1 glycogen/starch/alpha-glucan phosphorylase [Gammaproteobacteria bacterium]NND58330.1 glycogen/starch/alpha-glucan phosphorylase [Xanthomonadales bacterium]NNK51959.1 glycogen/starch/alpha-glucan phosphorylase [Xanthomonadales bacterium]
MVGILEKEDLKRTILKRLVYSVGKDTDYAVPHDWLVALTLAVRQRLMDRWMTTTKRVYETDVKRVYYLSMEFLIGRLLGDTMLNLGMVDLCRAALADLNIDLDEILEQEPDAALGNGGLGRLAACFMDSMSTLGIAAYGYGIRYEHGLFRQHIREGWQVEEAEEWLIQGGNPWELNRSESRYMIQFGGEVYAGVADGQVWQPGERVIAVGNDMAIAGWKAEHVNTLRLWSAKPAQTFDLSRFNEGNYLEAAQHEVLAETLSRVLYPDDSTPQGRELRLKQEYFFTSASLQDLLRRYLSTHDNLLGLPDHAAIQLNDTHPAIAVPELMRLLVDDHGMKLKQAFELTRQCISYTNHTLLPEALERWPLDMFGAALPRHLQIIEQVDKFFIQELNTKNLEVKPEDVCAIDFHDGNGGSVRMGNLAFIGSHRVNGVSELHTDLMTQTVFHDLHQVFPDRIVNMTNGVTPRRWLYNCNIELSNLVTEAIGDGWIGDLEQISKLNTFAEDSSFLDSFARAKRKNKENLGQEIQKLTGISVDPDALFDVQIKRIHEYKRQLLNALQIVARYQAILANPDADWLPLVKIFSGKAAPSYTTAKLIIKLINDIANTINNDPVVGDRLKVIYVPNYNVTRAEIIIPGADLSEQISTAGMEASGTGNMKLALNGALTIGTLDGANVEIMQHVGEENIFIFGLTAEQVAARRREGYAPMHIIEENPRLEAALLDIANGVFSGGDKELFKPLLDNLYHSDYFMLAADFGDYLASQRDVGAAYRDRKRWFRSAVLNTANVGFFSSDRTICSYDREIWHSKPSLHDQD